jgi:hypothetical protein
MSTIFACRDEIDGLELFLYDLIFNIKFLKFIHRFISYLKCIFRSIISFDRRTPIFNGMHVKREREI